MKQLDLNDDELAKAQVDRRLSDQGARHKAGVSNTAKAADIYPGSLVFIKEDGDKTRGRERYLVVKVAGNMCTLMKLNKSKLQKKEYLLKVTEVFPVQPTVEILDSSRRGLEEVSDEDIEIVEEVTLCSSQQNAPIDQLEQRATTTSQQIVVDPPIPYDLVPSIPTDTPTQDTGVDLNDSDSNDDDLEVLQAPSLNVQERRPRRDRRTPEWMKDYVPS